MRISFGDPSGGVFASDDAGLGMGFFRRPGADVFSQPLGPPPRLYKRREKGERYFGCGERTSGLEKTGSYQVFWNVDPPLGHTASFNNLYSSIPFTFSVTGGRAHGLFFDNTHRVEFDLALEDEDRAFYGAEGGNLVYYVFCGPTPADVLDRYTELTGRTPMPPLWSLGNQQSRYSYMDEGEVREVARGFRERDIPCDVIYLDIHYMDGYRVFTFDENRFPDPEKLAADLREEGFRLVTIVDPGVKVDENYPVYTEGRERDLFCKTNEGAEYHNAVWPGVCAFPDFANPETREWWGENQRALLDAGIAGIWCDMNEPALFIPHVSTMPGDVVHAGEDGPKLHAQIHNAYGSLMASAAREGLLRLRPDERPFVITRAGYAGSAAARAALDGGQLLVVGAPLDEHAAAAEPRALGRRLDRRGRGRLRGRHERRASGALDGVRGLPAVLPQPHHLRDPPPGAVGVRGALRVGVPRDAQAASAPSPLPLQPLRGVPQDRGPDPQAPPLRVPRGRDHLRRRRRVPFRPGLAGGPDHTPRHRAPSRLPAASGCWFHLWTGERFDGPAHVLAHAPLGQPPVYVRANTAVPMGPEMAHTGERPTDPLTLLLYPTDGAGESAAYEDAGDGFGYESGEYARRVVSCEESSGRVTVRVGEREGSFVPQRRELRLELRGIASPPESVTLDGEVIQADYDEMSWDPAGAAERDGRRHHRRGRALAWTPHFCCPKPAARTAQRSVAAPARTNPVERQHCLTRRPRPA